MTDMEAKARRASYGTVRLHLDYTAKHGCDDDHCRICEAHREGVEVHDNERPPYKNGFKDGMEEAAKVVEGFLACSEIAAAIREKIKWQG